MRSLPPAWRRRLRPVRWLSLRRTAPTSTRWGYDRGTPVDRHHIEAFLASHADRIRGRVLEVKDPRYTTRFGSEVTSSDIVDIDPGNERATVVCDLAEPRSLPHERFDCAIITQTLMYVSDPLAAVDNLWQSLAPGGSLLVTVATTSQVDPDSPGIDRWRITPDGLRHLLTTGCPGADVEVQGRGNLVVVLAFLHGLAAEDLPAALLDERDPRFAVVATGIARKPGTPDYGARSPR